MTAPAATPPAPAGNQPPAGSPPSPSPTDSPKPPSQFASLTPEQKDRLLEQQATAIRELSSTKQQTDKRLKDLEDALKANQPPRDVPAQTKEFFADPIGVLRKELGETVKPLLDFKSKVESRDEYANIKEQFKSDARFKTFLSDPQVEATLDRLMQNVPPTPQAVYATLLSLRGAQEFGEMPKPTSPPAGGQPPAGGGTPSPTVPPHMRPSSPPGPEPDPGKKVETRELTDNEMRLCRELGMTKEDYLKWVDESSLGVPTSKIGIKEKPAAGAAK